MGLVGGRGMQVRSRPERRLKGDRSMLAAAFRMSKIQTGISIRISVTTYVRF
jgi:hypothetical protein